MQDQDGQNNNIINYAMNIEQQTSDLLENTSKEIGFINQRKVNYIFYIYLLYKGGF